MYSKIPNELKNLKQWCIYKLVWDEQRKKYTKIPYDANTGYKAKSNDESTWSDYQTALDSIETYGCNGLGFFFKPPYFGVDIDNAEGEIERYRSGDIEQNMIYEFIHSFKSYAEYSPSGTGIHIIARGELPPGRRRRGDVEMYSDGRFFTMTGNSTNDYSEIVSTEPSTLKRIYDRYVGEKKVIQMNYDESQSVDLSIDEILDKAYKSKNGPRFQVFMQGGWEAFYSSQSEADMAFANDLAFWTGRDYSKMDELFRMSAMYRTKFDEKRGAKTYGQALLDKAIHETQTVYSKKEKSNFKIYIQEQVEKKETRYYSYDDTGNADRFCDIFGTLVKYSYINKIWYYYDGIAWKVDDTGEVRKMIDSMVDIMAKEPLQFPENMAEEEQEEVEKAWSKHLKRSRSNAGKNALMDEIKHRVAVLPDEFDKDKTLLNTQNGYLSLSDGILQEHDIAKMFTRVASTEYTDTIDCPRWEDFVSEIFNHDKELIRYIQKAVGYSLTGSTREQCMFILFGNGRNGKSVFIEVISEILGNYAMTMQAQTIMVKQNSSGANSDIARLKGARLVTSSEPNEGVRLDEGLVKQLTGGDKVTARHLYGKEFEFEPEFKLWLATNHKPIIRGTDDGIWRRMNLIPFTVQIPDHKVDKNLKNKLKTEMTGILNWAVEGCLMWQREGLKPPKAVTDASKEYRNEMDVITRFIEECCEIGPGKSVQAKELFSAYREWASENNEHDFTNTKFGREVAKKFKKKKSTYVTYEGLELVSNSSYQGVKDLFR